MSISEFAQRYGVKIARGGFCADAKILGRCGLISTWPGNGLYLETTYSYGGDRGSGAHGADIVKALRDSGCTLMHPRSAGIWWMPNPENLDQAVAALNAIDRKLTPEVRRLVKAQLPDAQPPEIKPLFKQKPMVKRPRPIVARALQLVGHHPNGVSAVSLARWAHCDMPEIYSAIEYAIEHRTLFLAEGLYFSTQEAATDAVNANTPGGLADIRKVCLVMGISR